MAPGWCCWLCGVGGGGVLAGGGAGGGGMVGGGGVRWCGWLGMTPGWCCSAIRAKTDFGRGGNQGDDAGMVVACGCRRACCTTRLRRERAGTKQDGRWQGAPGKQSGMNRRVACPGGPSMRQQSGSRSGRQGQALGNERSALEVTPPPVKLRGLGPPCAACPPVLDVARLPGLAPHGAQLVDLACHLAQALQVQGLQPGAGRAGGQVRRRWRARARWVGGGYGYGRGHGTPVPYPPPMAW